MVVAAGEGVDGGIDGVGVCGGGGGGGGGGLFPVAYSRRSRGKDRDRFFVSIF